MSRLFKKYLLTKEYNSEFYILGYINQLDFVFCQ